MHIDNRALVQIILGDAVLATHIYLILSLQMNSFGLKPARYIPYYSALKGSTINTPHSDSL